MIGLKQEKILLGKEREILLTKEGAMPDDERVKNINIRLKQISLIQEKQGVA